MQYTLTADKYADALRAGKFLGLKCNTCGAYTVPPGKVCCECHGENAETVELSRNGEVKSFTVIYTPAEGFKPPYIVGLIELEEGPWVTANIVNYPVEKATVEELIGRKGRIDYQEVAADMFSGGPRIALTFTATDAS
jgi:uncharacterized OB-fold protein